MCTSSEGNSSDMLRSIFSMQAELNDYVFKMNGLCDNNGNPLSMYEIAHQVECGRLCVNDVPNTWLTRFSRAMEEELGELRDELLWKWWSNDRIDLQNVRVELVDLLHFLVSAMLCAGITADKLHDLYSQKHAINLARQDSGYSQQTKTEEDNRTIQ